MTTFEERAFQIWCTTKPEGKFDFRAFMRNEFRDDSQLWLDTPWVKAEREERPIGTTWLPMRFKLQRSFSTGSFDVLKQ